MFQSDAICQIAGQEKLTFVRESLTRLERKYGLSGNLRVQHALRSCASEQSIAFACLRAVYILFYDPTQFEVLIPSRPRILETTKVLHVSGVSWVKQLDRNVRQVPVREGHRQETR